MDYKNTDDFDSDFHFDDIDAFCNTSVDTLINENKKIDVLDFDEKIETLDFTIPNKKEEVFDFSLEEPEMIKQPEVFDFSLEENIETEVLDFKLDDEVKPNIEALEFTRALELPLDSQNDNIEIDVSDIKEEKKKKNNKFFLETILAFLVAGLVFVGYKIVRWNIDNKAVASQLENINDMVQITNVEDNGNVVIIDSKDIMQTDEKYQNNDYYRFINEPLINVDFTKLLETNKDTIAWLQVNGTNINYPVVQTENNTYYLNHSFDKTYNEAGWLFADYRNNLTDDRNLIIYGHARLNLTMFGTLKNVVKKDWYTNKNNYVIKLSTPTVNSTWQVFSTYTIDPEDYYITTEFVDDNSFYEFIKILRARSIYNYNVELSSSDRIMTLSTCYSNNKRIVLHAKLIKYEERL